MMCPCGTPTLSSHGLCPACVKALAERTCREQGKAFIIEDPEILRRLAILARPEKAAS